MTAPVVRDMRHTLIAAALGLATKGGPSITAQAEKDASDWWIAERVLMLLRGRDKPEMPDAPIPEMKDPKPGMLEVFNQVAEEFHLSSERVAQIWYKLTSRVKH